MRTSSHALMRAVREHLRVCTVPAGQKTAGKIESFDSHAWASATFEGQRHEFTLRIDGESASVDDAASRLRGVLLESEMDLAGQLLADLVIIGEDTVRAGALQARRLHFEALTVLD